MALTSTAKEYPRQRGAAWHGTVTSSSVWQNSRGGLPGENGVNLSTAGIQYLPGVTFVDAI